MEKTKIYYARVDEFWTREEKLRHLESINSFDDIRWEPIQPDTKYNWLLEGLRPDYDGFMPLGTKEAKATDGVAAYAMFKIYSRGVATARDAWAYNFNSQDLAENIRQTIDCYNNYIFLWQNRQEKSTKNVDSLITPDDSKISWSDGLKFGIMRSESISFDSTKIRDSLYRPFTSAFLYFDQLLNERRYQFSKIFPTESVEKENQVICVVNEAQISFSAQITALIPCLHYGGRQTQCFPFYTYSEDGTNLKENITDWALEQFQTQYKDPKITKWDIFHYTYALLHHPHYRDRYAANLKRKLPRIPFAPEFHPFAKAGKRLTEIHINYEQQPEYRLKHIENKDLPIDWRVEKMRLSKDKTQIKYNDFLTLTGIPSEALEYRLGNRSALDWIIDQYQISTDKRSGITNDPNRLDDEEYIVRLIKQVITVSLETVKIVKSLPDLGLPQD
jgi:predicted helicase